MSPMREWALISVLAIISGAIMALVAFVAAWLTGFALDLRVVTIIGGVTAAIMVFEIRRQLR